MNDTTFEMDEKMREMCRLKTPTERFKMGCSMYDASRYLITCSILRNNPDISKAGLQKELFLSFYRDDFKPTEREAIIAHFEKFFCFQGI
ncbi:MAG: hypothetical protein HW387_1788 [Parachlamydiales bacterium]|nr:hypothetical protein [Parachlamydiales bacterium]